MNGARLKKLRTEKKLTQTELGKIINVTKVSISGYENGNRAPDTDTLKKIADYFEVSTDYLLGRTDNMESISEDNNELPLQAFANDPDLQTWYKELPKSNEEDVRKLRTIWEMIQNNSK